jgi:APA family basic amino acid/polyamine antiporter
MSDEDHPKQLKRELDWFNAAVMGLASVIGAGIFVSLGIASGISGSFVISALVVTGLLAACNSLNLAQLAVNHPVSGGIYEYTYKYLNPWMGFIVGWIYLLSKTAVAATAALGFSGYLLNALGINETNFLIPVAEVAVVIITLIVLSGMKVSKVSTLLVVFLTILSLLFLIVVGLFISISHGFDKLISSGIPTSYSNISFFQSVALMFVSYNGAARITMVGEEIVDPRQSIPKAVGLTIGVTMLLYVGVAIASIGTIGAKAFADVTLEQAAPLQAVANSFGIPGAGNILTIGAITSMLSILLTTILGVSRLLLAMGRRGDMPSFLSTLNQSGTTPYWAVLSVGMIITLLVLIGNVKTTWSLGTFGALSRSTIASLAALQLADEERLYPKWMTWLSFLSSVLLIFCVEWQYWLTGIGLIAVGLIWRLTIHQINSKVNLEPSNQ